jgi:hypothetical protein
MSASFPDPPAGQRKRTITELEKGMALEELRHIRTLTAAVRALKRKDPVKWATLGESHMQVLRAPVATSPICNKKTPFTRNHCFRM